MFLLQTYGKEIVSILVPFLAWFLNVFLKAKSKVVWSARHSFTFIVQEPLHDKDGKVVKLTQRVDTASIFIKNVGKESSKHVELVFNWKPQHLNVWPVRDYEQKTNGDKRYILIFDGLAPQEETGVEVMSINNDLPALIHVRTAESLAQNVGLMWLIPPPKWKMNLIRISIIVGAPSAIYLVIALIQLLVLKTPPAI